MNPILLKPTADAGCQVVVDGKVWKNLSARHYYEHRDFLWNRAMAAYERLAARFECVVIEGAGSVAEINLRDRDIVNLPFATAVGARGLLVADIDRGGVFASVAGTFCLLTNPERQLLRSFAINRFRGDRSLFCDGVQFLENRTGRPCLGVFPMARDIEIHEEDGVALDDWRAHAGARIAILQFPRISNLTDFRLLRAEWITRPVARQFSWVILPGTKATLADLEWMRAQGLDDWVKNQQGNGAGIFGICGGYQMLGETIADPNGVESAQRQPVRGLDLLPVQTVMAADKVTQVVKARAAGVAFTAYEIHMGRTTGAIRLNPFAALDDGSLEGAVRSGVTGTYLHGALENRALAAALFGEDNLRPPCDAPYDRLASWFAENGDMRLFEDLYL
jgi:adenosylcobyric acid synthase